MPLLILDFNAGLFVAYVNVFLLAIIWLLWYTLTSTPSSKSA